MPYDELDALLDPDGALEAKFRELEAEVDRVAAEAELRGDRGGAPGGTSDPLADLKSRVSGAEGAEARRVVLLLCPECDTKNRASVARLRQELPRCGRCGADLAFDRR